MPPVQQQFDLEVGQCHDMVPIERAFFKFKHYLFHIDITRQYNYIAHQDRETSEYRLIY